MDKRGFTFWEYMRRLQRKCDEYLEAMDKRRFKFWEHMRRLQRNMIDWSTLRQWTRVNLKFGNASEVYRGKMIKWSRLGPVSYTHLDVYKRQIYNLVTQLYVTGKFKLFTKKLNTPCGRA